MTAAITALETTRLTLQEDLDSSKTRAERNKLGQFATPPILAEDVMTHAKRLSPPYQQIRFLDPAFGTGSFYSALLMTFPASRVAWAAGYEIDSDYGQRALQIWGNTPLRLRIADFTQALPPRSDELRPNLLICNPPYVRHHHLDESTKLRLGHLAERVAGVRLSGLAGLYCYFLCISYGWMAENGLAGWLVPSEFMDVKYGRQIKEFLLNRVTLLQIHRFDPADVQFDDALVSSAVVWFSKASPPAEHGVEFTYGGVLTNPKISKIVPAEALRNSDKWTRFPSEGIQAVKDQGQLKLSDLFDIKRGIATGGNAFFILTAEQTYRYQIPRRFLWPILPSPRHLLADEIKADDAGAPEKGPKIFLLSCYLPPQQVKAKYPGLWSYLRLGRKAEIQKRYLCEHRFPWYSQEMRPPAPLLCTYMGRENGRNGKPFRFILNHSKATIANVYLAMYPKPYLARRLRDKPHLLTIIWKELNAVPLKTLLSSGRVYGGGLYKLEPNELGNVSVGNLESVLPASIRQHLAIRTSQLKFDW